MGAELDIVIPVYNEGANIVGVLARRLSREVKTPARVLICYDRPDDDTLPAVARQSRRASGACGRVRSQTPRRGAHAAIMAGFAASTAPFVAGVSGR